MVEVAEDYRVTVRKPRPTDQGFVADSWVRNVLQADRKLVRSVVNQQVDRLLDDQAVRLLIAHEPGQTDQILGWLAYTPLPRAIVVHFAYVRERIRRKGIGRALLREATANQTSVPRLGLHYTMRGPDAASLLDGRYRDAIKMDLTEFLGET